jgi:isocitrate/isopropylmalate dehydrogenase
MQILVLPGDGIGPEIVAATLSVLEAADKRFGLGLRFEENAIGLVALRALGTTLPDRVIEHVARADGVILGPVSHNEYPPVEEGGVNPSGRLRVHFDLYANIRPSRSRPDLTILKKPMDLVVVRENTEGFYADRNMHSGSGEFMPEPDIALALRKVTAKASSRIVRAACELARSRRKKLAVVHKANVLRMSDGLFLREARKVVADFPDVDAEELIVDAVAALLVRSPERFDVIVTTNMFGDILSDEASELAGGLGLGPSINAGDRVCVAQAQHGSAPGLAGRDLANPTALILSAAMLLDWRGRRDGNEALAKAATCISDCVEAAIVDPSTRTHDIGGTLGTRQFTDVVAAAVLGS